MKSTTEAKRVVLYARVSTSGQSTDNQLEALRAVAVRHGWTVVKEYVDKGISGARGREGRPAFDQMCQGVARREFDLIAAWSVDRLGRSLQDLVTFLSEVHAKHVDLYLDQQGIDTTTPAGKALFGMMGVFATFEREIIVERVKAGIKRAKAAGKVFGRPRVGEAMERKVMALRAEGRGMCWIGKKLDIAPGTVKRIIDATTGKKAA